MANTSTLRLTPSMYHRFHAPYDCTVDKVTYVSGDTWNVNPIALNRIAKLFCKNERAVIRTILRPSGIVITLVPVAAILVASIRLHFLGRPVEHAIPRGSRNSLPGLLQQRAGNGMVPTRLDHHRICTEGRRPLRLGAGGCGHPHGKAADAAAVVSGAGAMRILIATDAWSPQVNGVVRSLQSLAANARKLGAEIEFLTPEGFRSFPLPTYPSIRCGIPTWREIARRIELAAPDALHIATEGPIGHDRAALLSRAKNFLYDQLYDPFSGIRFGAAAGSRCHGATRCCAAFTRRPR